MRLVFTAILSFVLVAAFVAYFLLASILGYLDTPERLLESARNHDWRGSIVDLTAGYVAEEVAADPSLKDMSLLELRAIVSNAITEEWLEDSLRTGHAAIRSAIHGAQANAIFDLRETKSALRTTLGALKTRSESNCESLLGAAQCADADASRRMILDFERDALKAIAEVADEVDLLESVQGSDRDNAKNLQEGLRNLESVQTISLVVLLVSLVLILLLNSSSWRRVLVVTSLLAISSSAVYFLALGLSSQQASEHYGAALDASHQEKVREFSETLGRHMIDDAIFGAIAPVLLIAALGVAALIVMALRTRRA